MKKVLIIVLALFLTSCSSKNISDNSITEIATEGAVRTERSVKTEKTDLIHKGGKTIAERIMVPEGFDRVKVDKDSFAEYLRHLPLKEDGYQVKYYNGEIKPNNVYAAVIDMEIGNSDLQQCADAVIRLRAEYLYQRGFFDKIHFNFTNGFRVDYKTWSQGNRIKVEGNKAFWVKRSVPSNHYSSFRNYLDVVFAYAGTLSLSHELKSVPITDIRIGDVFIKGGSPGHCIIVVDMAENKTTGEKIFLTAQSYMPAQDIHVLKNPINEDENPWYSVDFGETLHTPEWDFSKDQLKSFID